MTQLSLILCYVNRSAIDPSCSIFTYSPPDSIIVYTRPMSFPNFLPKFYLQLFFQSDNLIYRFPVPLRLDHLACLCSVTLSLERSSLLGVGCL